MSTCPYCGATYHSTYPPITLSGRQREIYSIVASGGPRGTPAKRLISAVYGDKPPKSAWGVLRVTVFEINRKLKERNQRIRGRRDVGYVLTRDSNGGEDD
jgi:hypothetical protein